MKNMIKYAADMGANSAQQRVQEEVAAVNTGAECRRVLSTANYAQNTTVVVDIPRDTSIKRLNLLSRFAATVTFASGK